MCDCATMCVLVHNECVRETNLCFARIIGVSTKFFSPWIFVFYPKFRLHSFFMSPFPSPLIFSGVNEKVVSGFYIVYIYILASTTYCHLSPWIPHILYYSSFEQGGKSHRFLVRFIAILQLGSKSGLILSKFRRRKNLHSFCQSRQIISVQKRKQLKVFKMQNFLKLGLFHNAVGEISVLYNTVVNSGRYLIHCILYRYVNSKSITRLSRSANDCIAYWRLKFFLLNSVLC